MSEELNNEELDQKIREKINQEVAEAKEKEDLMAQWEKEIDENAEMQKYFEGFKGFMIKSFIKSYLRNKYNAYKQKDYYADKVERARTRWIDRADDHLEPILQKKLFDLQVLWRAEQITLEGVELIADFDIWENDIFNCPYVEILPEDIELYQEFLKDGQLDRSCRHYEWQNYRSFKEEEDEDDLPEWYIFHNLRTGNSNLRLMPDIRGEKEEFYRNLYFEDQRAKETKPSVPYDERPMLSFDYDSEYAEFAAQFDDEETKRNMDNWVAYNRHSGYDSDVSEVVMRMEEIDDFIPIESHYDYREAIRRAYNNYCYGKIVEHLPMAYEQYLFTKNMNLGFSTDRDDTFYYDLRKTYFDQITAGRILNGEPGDLDF